MKGLLVIIGSVFCLISIASFIKNVRSEVGVKDKIREVIDYFIDPFTGFTSLFYAGVLMLLVALMM